MKLVECVPNISEGRRSAVYDAVANAAASVPGVTLLNVDPGADTNRTVITFVGSPEAVVEAAYQLIAKAVGLIDMAQHQGAHPRMGAVDVVPFVPVSGVTMEECADLARQLGGRVGESIGIPIYLYEYAASTPQRRNLADIRAGEYEGLREKMVRPEWKPDFGPVEFNVRSGATAIGARKFLVAYNVNLNTMDKRLANRVAFDIREKGRPKKDASGKPMLDDKGEQIWTPGMLEEVKAVGWTIPEFGCAQVSINLTDLDVTPLHVAFDACDERARARGLRVTGSELVGLVPKSVLLEAGRYYLRQMGRSTGVSEGALIDVAVRTLGLNEVKPFDPAERIIENRLSKPQRLVSMTLRGFADELASESPAPGGGSVSALVGALGAALAAMVANLTHPKEGFERSQDRLELIGVEAQQIKARLLDAVDEDTTAFDAFMDAMRLPKDTDDQKKARASALTAATVAAIEVPLAVLEACPRIIELCKEIGRIGLQVSLSDAGVGAQVARAAAAGAYQNVCINMSGLTDASLASDLLRRADRAWELSRELHEAAEKDILVSLRRAAEPAAR